MLASLPLCQEDLKAGHLRRVSKDSLSHYQTYWLLAAREAVSRTQWNILEKELKSIG